MTAPLHQDVHEPPSPARIGDDEIAHVVVVLQRTGLGLAAHALHLADEGVAHDVATVLAEFGPTWLIGLYDDPEMDRKRYRPGCSECGT